MHPLTISLLQMVFTLAPLARNPARKLLYLVASAAGKLVYMSHCSVAEIACRLKLKVRISLFLTFFTMALTESSAIAPFPVLHARYLNLFQ